MPANTFKKIWLFSLTMGLIVFGRWAYQKYYYVPTIRLAVNEWAGFAPAVYAQVLGLYEMNDVPIELVYNSGPAEMVDLFKNEQVDGITTVLTDQIMLRSSGLPIKAIFMVDYSQAADVLISGPDIHSVADLKGKTIGIDALNSFSHVFILHVLAHHGLSERDVFFKIIPFNSVFMALQKGEVQAAHTWDPEKRRALSNGYKVLAAAGDTPGAIMDGVGFREEILKKYPEVFQRFTKVFFEAQTKMLENPYEAARKMKDFYKNDPTAFASTFKEIHFIDLNENRQKMKRQADNSFYKDAYLINEFFIKRGQANEKNLYEQVLTGSFL